MPKNRVSASIKEHLVTRLEYLQNALHGSASRLKEGVENFSDPLDRATTEHERAVELTIRFRESQEMKEIKEALGRIEKGQYGMCSHCGKPISQKRLLLAPMSRLCIDCKAAMEARQRGRSWRPGDVAFGER